MRKNGFKILSMVLIIMLMATSFAFAAVPADVAGQDYEAAVEKLMAREIITGDTDGLFHPESTLTRAQACIMVVKAMNPPVAELFGTATQSVPASGFTDMAGYGWAAPYINYAVKNGITLGVGNYMFNPGGQVKTTELITFTLRAAGNTDQSLGGTWPENYLQKAKDLDLETGLPQAMPEYVSKWMTAQFVFNALSVIDKAQNEVPAPSGVILTGLTYVVGSFDDNITTFDNKPLDKNVAVYTYEVKDNYKKDMVLSKKTSDYLSVNYLKYKRVTTPAQYLMSGGKIVQIILPYDVGWTGTIYGIINSKVTALNGAGESVVGLDTWTVMKEITWLCKNDSTVSSLVPSKDDGKGDIYEMHAINGEVRNITTTGGTSIGKVFEELASSKAVPAEVDDMAPGLIGISGSAVHYYEVSENPTVYVLQKDGTYKPGSISSVREGKFVRMYNISSDKKDIVDIVVVMK